MDTDLQKQFELKDISSSGRKVDILPKLNSYGDFSEINGKDAVINAVRNVLMCPRGTYPFDPEYGSDFYKKIFEPMDIEVQQEIQFELEDTIRKYVPEVILNSIDIKIMNKNKSATVNLMLSMRDEKNMTKLSLNIKNLAEDMFSTDDDIYSDTNSIGGFPQ